MSNGSRPPHEPMRDEPFWQAQAAALVALALYLTLPTRLTLSPRWLIAGLEGALLLALVATQPRGERTYTPWRRAIDVTLIALVTVTNTIALGELVDQLLNGARTGGRSLILAGGEIWLTNLLIFALWYWALDRGGPRPRKHHPEVPPDFLFPQMTSPEWVPRDWRPKFIDYLYVAFTNATAFSPTDTMPLTPLAKMLMLVQALVSFLVAALVVARAVNILG